jgi:hypothetical protein
VTKLREGSTPDRIVGVLEADGGWMSVAQLVMELEWRWRAVKLETVRTATQRLTTADVLESRLVERSRTPVESRPWGVAGEPFGSHVDHVAEWRVA